MLMDISKLWEDTTTKTVVHVSFMEIYNDKVRDLLADGKAFDEPEVCASLSLSARNRRSSFSVFGSRFIHLYFRYLASLYANDLCFLFSSLCVDLGATR